MNGSSQQVRLRSHDRADQHANICEKALQDSPDHDQAISSCRSETEKNHADILGECQNDSGGLHQSDDSSTQPLRGNGDAESDVGRQADLGLRIACGLIISTLGDPLRQIRMITWTTNVSFKRVIAALKGKALSPYFLSHSHLTH